MPKHQSSPATDYIRKTFAPQDSVLAGIDARLKESGMAIHVGAEEGKLLEWLVKLSGAKKIVEVGTLGGYSAIWMARALPEGGHLYTLEKEASNATMARAAFKEAGLEHTITLIEGSAGQMLETLNDRGLFDMIFIDADKPGYNAYLDWAEKHLRKGALIVADNTLLFGSMALDSPPEGVAPTTWEGMRRFNQRLADPQKYDGTMIPTREGLTVAIKRF